ncbi:acyl-CoA dehydrogenase family protein [Solimonas marina]|uniref:Acyl-CoA/acyl-ACP dehydrogenase n=1 Tax=Solimonas marina TaxID=2714601 RepID=A0A969W6P4_9GAMM|nr:acyl-CoA dehydrogenase family protein [Solimonas marina]NKF20938.1 acyl-CoA/acyl-ACP dehydrogenase [Solimonas marina]
MDFTFDDQQLAFRDAIHKFLMVEAAPEMLREIWETTASGRSAELRAKLADQGLTALSVPEEFGGIGVGDLDWVLVQQELGYFAIPDSLTDSAYLAAHLLNQLPADVTLKREWLPRLAAGKARIAVGHPVNPLVADAALADLLLLWRDDEVHAVTRDQVKLTFNPSIDLSRRLYAVEWSASPATRICPAKLGRTLWADVLDRAALAASAQLLGLAQRMLDLGVDHAAQRKQFGKPVGSFQAVKHHLADVAVKIEFAEPIVHRAACALADNDPQRAVHVSHAKLAAGDAARLAGRKSIQAHGAMGYTWEADLQMYLKRAWALDSAWGDNIFHKSRIDAAVLDQAAAIGPGCTFSSRRA